jgi:hypothetical protein
MLADSALQVVLEVPPQTMRSAVIPVVRASALAPQNLRSARLQLLPRCLAKVAQGQLAGLARLQALSALPVAELP